MPFTNYEQIHLHRYVDRKDTSYKKAVTDIKINLYLLIIYEQKKEKNVAI